MGTVSTVAREAKSTLFSVLAFPRKGIVSNPYGYRATATLPTSIS